MKLYLKPTGSVCYDNTGVTFPVNTTIPIEDVAKVFFGRQFFGWENHLGQSNLPKVLVFQSNWKKGRLFEQVVNAFYYRGFIVVQAHW